MRRKRLATIILSGIAICVVILCSTLLREQSEPANNISHEAFKPQPELASPQATAVTSKTDNKVPAVSPTNSNAIEETSSVLADFEDGMYGVSEALARARVAEDFGESLDALMLSPRRRVQVEEGLAQIEMQELVLKAKCRLGELSLNQCGRRSAGTRELAFRAALQDRLSESEINALLTVRNADLAQARLDIFEQIIAREAPRLTVDNRKLLANKIYYELNLSIDRLSPSDNLSREEYLEQNREVFDSVRAQIVGQMSQQQYTLADEFLLSFLGQFEMDLDLQDRSLSRFQ